MDTPCQYCTDRQGALFNDFVMPSSPYASAAFEMNFSKAEPSSPTPMFDLSSAAAVSGDYFPNDGFYASSPMNSSSGDEVEFDLGLPAFKADFTCPSFAPAPQVPVHCFQAPVSSYCNASSLGLPGHQGPRPNNPSNPFCGDYFDRNMAFLKSHMDLKLYSQILEIVEAQYKEFKVKSNKNKHRVFWRLYIEPCLSTYDSLLNSNFFRIAVMGRMNGLAPRVTREFYALIEYLNMCTEIERSMLLQACSVVIPICESDPCLTQFPLL
jgi:hypothetical protein